MRGRQEFEWTQRPLLKIITSIKDKIVQKIGEDIGYQYSDDIKNALAAQGVESKLMDMMQNDQIDLIDEHNRPILKTQIQYLSNSPMDRENILEEEENSPIHENLPDAKTLERASLQMNEQQYSELKEQVVQIVRRDSLLREAKDL